MAKEWIKTSNAQYFLRVDEKDTWKMEINFKSLSVKAVCTLGDKILEIKRTGFWKSGLEVTDKNGTVILTAAPEKWYANTSIIEYAGKKYQLKIRNNPLAEYVIRENEQDLVAYGLATEKRELRLRITGSEPYDDIFDLLLWYLFVPVATENFSDSFLFLVS